MVTLAVDDDFSGFVAARWPDLEAVALVAAPDADTAREVTATTLARLGERWDDALDEGSPTRAARAALLKGLGALGADGPRVEATDLPLAPAADPPAAGGTVGDPVVAAALIDTVRHEHAVVRAALAAGAIWGCDDAEVAALAGVPADRLASLLSDARSRLVSAHRAALAAEGLEPADWRLERDLTDALDALAAASPDPPDPAALVAERTRGVRRRSVLTGGAALVAAGGLGWWLLRDTAAGDAGDTTTAEAPRPVGNTDAVWDSTTQWPPRGSLAGDTGILALVITDGGPGARLLFAEDVGPVRIAVAALLDRPNQAGPGTALAVWTGAAGAPVERLSRVPLALDRTDGVPDVVALTVPAPRAGSAGARSTRMVVVGVDSEPGAPGAATTSAADEEGSLLLVLARPTVGAATWSPVVHPTPNGSVERTWTLLRLDGGVGALRLDGPAGTAARLQCGGYDGPVAGTSPVRTTGLDPSAAAAAVIAAATGIPVGELRSEVVVDSPVDGSVLDAGALSALGADGRVRVILTTTPDGALVRTLHVVDDGRSGRGALVGTPRVLPARRAGAPLVRRLDVIPPRTTRFLVVAPGAAQCQLLATQPAAYPLSKVVPLKGDTAVVPVVNGQDAGTYRLVLWDADGTKTYSDVPPRGRALLDLTASY